MFEQKHIPNRKPDEHLIYSLHAHWIKLVYAFILFFAQLAILAAFYLGAKYLFPNLSAYPAINVLAICFATLYLLMAFLLLFNNYLDYQLDVWIITNHRIIAIIQTNLFNRTISEYYIEKIQDVSANEKGILQNLFRFGDVMIQTASEKPTVYINDVPHPFKVAEIINGLIYKDVKKEG